MRVNMIEFSQEVELEDSPHCQEELTQLEQELLVLHALV